MKKHPTLPQHIIKISKHFYLNTKTNKRIHTSRLEEHCPKEINDEYVRARRWDLNY